MLDIAFDHPTQQPVVVVQVCYLLTRASDHMRPGLHAPEVGQRRNKHLSEHHGLIFQARHRFTAKLDDIYRYNEAGASTGHGGKLYKY